MKNTMTPSMMSLAVLALMASLAVTGCGGGGGSSDSSTPTTQEPGKLTLSGVVATQTVQAAAAVVAKCAVGGGAVTAAADGTYSLSFDKALLPCVLEADLLDGTRLHSVAYGASGATTATANITPVTELVVANVSSAKPAEYFASFSQTAASGLTSSKLEAASTAVTVVLKDAGIDLGSTGNVITSPVVIGSAGTSNTYGQALATLETTLTSTGATLAQLSTTVAASTAPSDTISTAASLPASMMLKPAAADCAALRSGAYYVMGINPSNSIASGAPVTTVDTAIIDATALTYNTPRDSGVLTPLGNCRYTFHGGNSLFAIAPSGVGVARGSPLSMAQPAPTDYQLNMLIPVQTMSVSDFTGNGRGLAWNKNDTGNYDGVASESLVDNFGVISTICEGMLQCVPVSLSGYKPLAFAVDLSGGFMLTAATLNSSWINNMRYLAYRSGGGALSSFNINQEGSFGVGAPSRNATLKSVGDTKTVTNFRLSYGNRPLAITPVWTETQTVTASSSAAGTYTQQVTSSDGIPQHSETLVINAPRAGYIHRLADGVAGVREAYIYEPAGTGLTITYRPAAGAATADYTISVQQ